MRELLLAGVVLLGGVWPAMAGPAKMAPGYRFDDSFGFWSGALRQQIDHDAAAGKLDSLPHWTHRFDVAGKRYSYTLLGSDPAKGPAVTVIPTVLIPIRLSVARGDAAGHDVVFDATQSVPRILRSPIFTPAKFASGKLQFTDAMLHMEFPAAPAGWHLVLSPSVASTINVQATQDQVQILHSESGTPLGVIRDGRVLNDVITDWVHHNYSPHVHPIFITYNALAGGAFGFHSAIGAAGGQMVVFTYTSWLEGAGNAFGIPSPDADTLAHEEAEVVHDAFGTSLTRTWGDWFRQNACFQRFIEVGDAVEDAPAQVQNWKQKTQVNGREEVFTLQSEALLPWFERKFPSPALHSAYSFPNETAILGPAPVDCEK